MSSFVNKDIENSGDYITMLSAVAKLSGLFSDSAIPYLNYRVAENIFCRSFNAENLSRSDTAFDARIDSLGIGLKTFICSSNNSVEKVAEFNSLSRIINESKGKELAIKLATYRNDRINLANRIYNIEKSLYHIVARKEKSLSLFETDYDLIDVDNINAVKESRGGLQFTDGKNYYSFNTSKSTLFRKFIIPENTVTIPIDIIDDPYALLLELFQNKSYLSSSEKSVKGINYVVLPLYGIKNRERHVFEKSGINQWNAVGRKRDFGEVYIPIPIEVHKKHPGFFPERDKPFNLTLPSGEILSAKVCQENSKALMTDPNKAISDWLLRRVLLLQEGELATIEKLDELGFDSVILVKNQDGSFKIDIMKTGSYEIFNLD
jgi:hypothetical protein